MKGVFPCKTVFFNNCLNLDGWSKWKVGVPIGVFLKKFQVGRYEFQVGVGGKTWKSVLIKVETATKPKEIRHVLGWKK